MLYTIVFDDNSTFTGGDLKNTKWLEIPDKPIRTIFYNLPLGDCLGLSGYNAYYHYVEATKDLMGKNKGLEQLEYTYLIGRSKDLCKVYKISLKTGGIQIFILNKDDNQIKQLNPIGWKNGK